MEIQHPDPLRLLAEKVASYRAPQIAGLPRFCGGAVGYAGYDAVRYVENLPSSPAGRPQPARSVLRFLRPHGDLRPHQQDHCRRGTRPRRSHNLKRSYQTACDRVDRLVERLQQGVADLQLTDIAPVGDVHLPYRSNFEPIAFEEAVQKCKEYIKAGDIFQVVLSQRLQAETKAQAV